MRSRVAFGLLVGMMAAGSAAAQPAGPRHVKASLVAETDAVVPGAPLVVGFHLEMEPGWHTYWRNPGDSGLPTKVKWDLPAGLTAGELLWPRPIRFATGPLVSYGYEHEVLHPVEIRVAPSVSAGEVRIAARLSWLECREACLPGKAELNLTLPVRRTARSGSAAALFAHARRTIPHPDSKWTFGATAGDAAIGLSIGPPPGAELREAYFYPFPRRVLDYSKPQALTAAARGYRLELTRDPNGEPVVERLAGVLVGRTASGKIAVELDVPVSAAGSSRSAAHKDPR